MNLPVPEAVASGSRFTLAKWVTPFHAINHGQIAMPSNYHHGNQEANGPIKCRSMKAPSSMLQHPSQAEAILNTTSPVITWHHSMQPNKLFAQGSTHWAKTKVLRSNSQNVEPRALTQRFDASRRHELSEVESVKLTPPPQQL